MSTASPEIPGAATRARPTAANRIGEDIWSRVKETGEIGAPRDYLLERLHCTPSQFERGKGYIRDFTAMAAHEAFLATRGVYVVSTDTNLCSEYVGWRLRGIDRELRRMLSGAILPLGASVTEHAVLTYYREEIARMLKIVDGMRERGFPVSALLDGAPAPQ
ncbi:hypothetical protein [Streptosporangium roseum]|uniref:hypothetical protein n=1 Tax=Streptosporangium roseum TaxID=2001 RepID=UPI0034409FE2